MRAHRKRSRATVDQDAVLALDPELASSHASWTAAGFALASGRLWRCKDGSWTVRLVWRKRGAVNTTISFTRHGVGSFAVRAITP
jgi:hypothetical protein